MENGAWDEPVTFETEKLGRYLTVTSTSQACRVLLDHWPHKKGKALKKAKEACLMALKGEIAPNKARTAFLLAAKEAGVFTREK